jgi:hypothetical protein
MKVGMDMEKNECSGITCWEGSHCIETLLPLKVLMP